ncbi:UbiA family prenyltransferase [Nocardioides albus]|uniref:4-hydroxybenzoate polyprenyltransferase/phosphoserine phosphatase n=1 Tax=Nocardioides albus TaxID=1841 RepID=A0A7W5A427_9ACTN|nr:UbiA family prenyltransferase [Nocardioides albus]MBB3089311.1 4-hydroxybenzoate polyprenyltransferase/phosphoserine phosphatase [Nocardioides albus]
MESVAGAAQDVTAVADAVVERRTGADRPLVVDLDGTLLRTDLLHEQANALLVGSPRSALSAAVSLRRGRAALKHELARRAGLDASGLPYHDEFVAWLRAERMAGRSLVLATASDAAIARQVAEDLGIFDEVIASADGVNLKGEEKAAALVARYGEDGFDYVGDHSVDLAVWRRAHTAHVVGSERLRRRAHAVAEPGNVWTGRRTRPRDLLGAARPMQWLKNLLVVVPLFTAQRIGVVEDVVSTALAFVAFCLVASSIYLLNDLADLANDRRHPTKKNRPFAAGRVSLLTGWVVWPVFAAAGFALSLSFLPLVFTGVLLGYLVATSAYTFVLKSRPVLDVVTLGGLYTLRIVAGAAALNVELSMWLLTFSMFFFLSLALIKRVSELSRVRRTAGEINGRGYVESDLELLSSFGVVTGVASIVIFSLYVDDPLTSVLYRTPVILWASVPVMLTWLLRVWMLAHRGQMNEDPVLFAARDRFSLLCFAAVAACFVLAKVVVW